MRTKFLLPLTLNCPFFKRRYEDFLKMLEDAGLINENFGTLQAKLCFVYSNLIIEDEMVCVNANGADGDRRHMLLSFEDFLEALCRMVDMSGIQAPLEALQASGEAIGAGNKRMQSSKQVLGNEYWDRLAELVRTMVRNLGNGFIEDVNPAARLVGQAQSKLLFKLRADRLETERLQKGAKAAVKGWKARAKAWKQERDDAVAEGRLADMLVHPGEPPPGMGYAHLD
jgi:hypothetical protein